MLNFDVKRKINTLRDILVGKVPDPKAQVEQITIALIYKFMDDIDQQGADFGGSREFFKGEYEKYAFTQIMLAEHSAQDRLNLYAEGIEKMTNNPDLPKLFRDILRNAYIPYRDPETLNRFLKEIAEFSYEDSEELGNAFEYLLSIMGSQGDAGQFRTPRHIIDMMVEITAPAKNETILDPACGTAGFLISAYNYIKKTNLDEQGKSTLVADDKTRMTRTFAGYDISPDMVRLSRVNMYLHGFTNPNISEYDTLTSLEKWDDTYDVIFSNPPFMTPKGGITPHNRYQVSAKRAEVLFVDYIAEHLNPTGRAAIIVPEGIVFQSQTAYKNLRKMLVDGNYLYGVISLPAGVFNPYSGVKTSILLIDRTLAKERDNILFVKLNNDGYDLGAQRREIKGSEIPDVINIFRDYQNGIDVEGRENIVLAKKSDISEQNYILVGDRYIHEAIIVGKWPRERLGNVCKFERHIVEDSTLPYIGMEDVESGTGNISSSVFEGTNAVGSGAAYAFDSEHILYGRLRPYLNKVATPSFIGRCSTELIPIRPGRQILKKYLATILRSEQSISYAMGTYIGARMPRTDLKAFSDFPIPLPPLSVQEEIVAEIESYQKIINGAQQVVENYKPTIKVDPAWPMVSVGDMYNISYGVTISIPQCLDENGIKIVSTAEVGLDGRLDYSKIRRVKYEDKYRKFILEPDTLLFNWRNAPKHVGKTALFLETDEPYISASFLLSLKNKNPDAFDNRFIWCALNNLRETGYFMRNARQAVNQTNFNGDQLSKTMLAVPPIGIQRDIVNDFEEEMVIVDQNKRLIEIFQQKIKDKIAEVWGE